MSATAPAQPSPAVPTLFDLFTAFALISVYAFGGVLAWSRRMLVEERKWMTAEEFKAVMEKAKSVKSGYSPPTATKQ